MEQREQYKAVICLHENPRHQKTASLSRLNKMVFIQTG